MEQKPYLQRVNRSPFNLTSEAVHRILLSHSVQLPTPQKIYPMVKYQTDNNKANVQTSLKKKLKQLDLPKDNSKISIRTRSQNSRTQLMKFRKGLKQQKYKNKHKVDEGLLVQTQMPLPQKLKFCLNQTSMVNGSSEKYLQKVNKIKYVKLKKYLKNKFAIQAIGLEAKQRQILNNECKAQLSQRLPKKMQTQTEQNKEISKDQKQQQIKRKNNLQVQTCINEQNQSQLLKQTSNIGLQKRCVTLYKREAQDHPADIRFDRLRNHLSKILMSYNCKNQMLQNKLEPYFRNCQKYKYYVGSGNNKNLIISMMKKRWWWCEASNINEADFVWTQLKQQKILAQVPKLQEKLMPIITNIKRSQKSIQNTLQIKIKSKSLKLKQEQSKLFYPQSRIRTEKQIYDSLIKHQIKNIHSPKKMHNHYQGNGMIGNKKALFRYFSRYCEYKSMDRYQYIPLTFHISSKKCAQLQILEQTIKNEQDTYWLIKPGENSNRGNGISITNDLQEIKQRINNMIVGSTLIIQKYITNIILFNSRKFDIRAYMLAVTISGSTKFYWHDQGYLRTSSYVFNLKNCSNLFVHLTNDAIQSQSNQYSKFQQGNKISYRQFQRYLDESYPRKDYSITQAHEKMKNIAKMVVKSAYPLINCSNLQFSLELFGLDFILDKNLNPWLIQVNTNPCLQLSSTCLKRLIPHVIQNAMRISLDPIFPPCIDFPRSMSSYVPQNIIKSNRFSIIFDDNFDRDTEWQNILANEPVQFYEGEQQQFQGDGQILQPQLA